jgi:hypothetical protein
MLASSSAAAAAAPRLRASQLMMSNSISRRAPRALPSCAAAAAAQRLNLAGRRRRAVACAAAADADADATAATTAGAAADNNAAATAATATTSTDTDGEYWAAALWGDEDYANPTTTTNATTTSAMTPDELKRALLDSFFGAERGLSAGAETRAEVAELLSQLEASRPPPEDPRQALEMLDGEWRLAYTSGSELLAVLALGRLPGVTVGDVTQTIDSRRRTFENAADVSALSGAAGTTRLTAKATFEPLSARRIAVRFESGGLTAPRLSGALPFVEEGGGLLPDVVSLPGGGPTLDLSPLRPALAPLEEGARAALALVGGLLERAPDLEVPIPGTLGGGALAGALGGGLGGGGGGGGPGRTWLVTTYLDEDLRVSRGDGGGVFVLQKVAGVSGSAAAGEEEQQRGQQEWSGRAEKQREEDDGASATAWASASVSSSGWEEDNGAAVVEATVIVEPSSSSSDDPASSTR